MKEKIFHFAVKLEDEQEIVGIVLYNHKKEKIGFKATEKTGHEVLMGLLRKEIGPKFKISEE